MIKMAMKVLYTVIPIGLFIWLSPILAGSFFNLHKAFWGDDTSDIRGIPLFVVPIYLGLIAAPGYLYSLFFEPIKNLLSPFKRNWTRISLVVVTLCSVYGVTIGYMLPFLSPLAFVVMIMSLHLLVKFERGKQ